MCCTCSYRAVLWGLEEQQRIDKERAAKQAKLEQDHAAASSAARTEARAAAAAQLPPTLPPPPPKLPLSYTYCFHPAANTWVPAARAATAAAPTRTKPAKTPAPQQPQQEAGGRRSTRTNCHATADSLWISTPRTYSYSAAADTWVLPSTAPPSAAAATTTQEPAAAAAAAKGGGGVGGSCSMRYSHFIGGWVQTQLAPDAELPTGVKQRCARCTYQFDAVSDAWVCSAAPVAAAAKAMAAPAAGGSCSAASHLCTAGGWLSASNKVYSFDAASNTWALPDSSVAAVKAASPGGSSGGSESAAAHIPTTEGWLPAPPTYSYDPDSGTWALRSAAAAATTTSDAPAAPIVPAADTAAAASAFEQAAAAVAFAQAPSPPAFLAFARRGSPSSRAAAAEAAAGAAAVASALSPPAALAFARRGSPTSRAATAAAAAKPAAAQAILLPPPPPPQQHGSRTYAYDAARDAWFCPTLDYVSTCLRYEHCCITAANCM